MLEVAPQEPSVETVSPEVLFELVEFCASDGTIWAAKSVKTTKAALRLPIARAVAIDNLKS